MSDLANIIKTKIIDKKWDIFWDNISLDQLQAKDATVLIITQKYEAGSSEEAQLLKILQACTLTTDQYNILHLTQGQSASWHKLRDILKPKVVLLAGITPQQLGISAMFRLHSPNKFNDCIMIPAISLPELEQQADAKRQLWQEGLKLVFVDKTVGNP